MDCDARYLNHRQVVRHPNMATGCMLTLVNPEKRKLLGGCTDVSKSIMLAPYHTPRLLYLVHIKPWLFPKTEEEMKQEREAAVGYATENVAKATGIHTSRTQGRVSELPIKAVTAIRE